MKYIFFTFILFFLHLEIIQAQTRKVGFNLECGILAKEVTSSGFMPGMLSFTSFYNLNQGISIGGGLGYVIFESVIDKNNIRGIPVFAYGRWNFLPTNKFSPFVAARVGYGIISQNVSYTLPTFDKSLNLSTLRVDESYSGGSFNSISAGTLYHLFKDKYLILSLSANHQYMKGRDNVAAKVKTFHTIGLSVDLGISF